MSDLPPDMTRELLRSDITADELLARVKRAAAALAQPPSGSFESETEERCPRCGKLRRVEDDTPKGLHCRTRYKVEVKTIFISPPLEPKE